MDIMLSFSILISILFWWTIISLFRGGKYKTLVLKKFLLEPDNADGNIATIVARRSGLFSWLLTHLFKISPETSMTVTKKDLCFKYKSISKEENVLITLKNGIAHIYCKHHKPFGLLVLSIVILLVGIIASAILKQEYEYEELSSPVFITSLIISIILFLMFIFKKSIEIMVETCGNTKYRIKFKPSLIEGQDVNLDKAREVIKVIQEQIHKEQE